MPKLQLCPHAQTHHQASEARAAPETQPQTPSGRALDIALLMQHPHPHQQRQKRKLSTKLLSQILSRCRSDPHALEALVQPRLTHRLQSRRALHSKRQLRVFDHRGQHLQLQNKQLHRAPIPTTTSLHRHRATKAKAAKWQHPAVLQELAQHHRV